MRPRGQAGRISRAQLSIAARLYVVFAILALGSCDSSKSGGVGINQEVSTTLSISAYSQARIRASGGAEMQYSFPLLEIYNGSGALVFHGHDATANAKVLQDFPGALQNYQPQDQAPRLENVIAQIPDFKAMGRRVEEIQSGCFFPLTSRTVRDAPSSKTHCNE